jgi:hypothetical protein
LFQELSEKNLQVSTSIDKMKAQLQEIFVEVNTNLLNSSNKNEQEYGMSLNSSISHDLKEPQQ